MLAAAAAATVATAATASLAVYCRPATIASLKYHSVQVQINLFIYFTEVTTVYAYTSIVLPMTEKSVTRLISQS